VEDCTSARTKKARASTLKLTTPILVTSCTKYK
jgi:hypothetical protein